MRVPLKCLVWRAGLLPQMSEEAKVGDVIRSLGLLEAHVPSDLIAQDIVMILPGQEQHPLYEHAWLRWRSRVGVELERMVSAKEFTCPS